MSDIPPEVFPEILSRVPAQSLLRFRCVSKPWRELIDSPEFIKLHLDRTLKSKSNLKIIARQGSLCSIDFDSLHDTAGTPNSKALDHPLKCDDLRTEVLGSCHGLLCLYHEEEGIFMWNPLTRSCQQLPVPEIELPVTGFICWCSIYGFGYDPVRDDYKVVQMARSFRNDDDSELKSSPEVNVFSLKLNSWRRIQDFPYNIKYYDAHGVLVNGALHWVVTRSRSDTAKLLAAFDLGTEEYRIVLPPNFFEEAFVMIVEEFDGCLSVFCHYYTPDHDPDYIRCAARVDVWVMKEYGVRESWTKSFSFSDGVGLRNFEYAIPIAYSNGREQVLLIQDDKWFTWYDLKKKWARRIQLPGCPDHTKVFICFETLVHLNGTNPVKKGRAQESRKKKKNSKKRDDFLSEGFKLVL